MRIFTAGNGFRLGAWMVVTSGGAILRASHPDFTHSISYTTGALTLLIFIWPYLKWRD